MNYITRIGVGFTICAVISAIVALVIKYVLIKRIPDDDYYQKKNTSGEFLIENCTFTLEYVKNSNEMVLYELAFRILSGTAAVFTVIGLTCIVSSEVALAKLQLKETK